MFNVEDLKDALDTAIGLRDSDDPTLPTCTKTTSDTGSYYNDYHPLVTWDNLYSMAPNYDGNSYADFSSTATYATGDIAKTSNVAYEALRTIAATSTLPSASTAWASPVNSWVTEKIDASIGKLTNDVRKQKIVAESSKTFLSTIQLIDGAGRIEDTITADSRFVGFEIIPKYTNNIKGVLDYIGLQFNATQSNIPLYLYHSSQYSPIGIFRFTTTTVNSFDWQSASSNISTGMYSMPYIDYANNIDAGGTYYLGYFEDDISGSAIEKDYVSCYSSTRYRSISQWMSIRPIAVSTLNGTNLFDIDDVGYVDSSFGLNLSLSVKTDVTELLVSNKGLFTDALGYQFALDMLDEMLHNSSSRINRNQENATRNKILYELTQDQNDNNLYSKYIMAVKALGIEFGNLSQVLPKPQPGIQRTWR